jgi:hypothetical protein
MDGVMVRGNTVSVVPEPALLCRRTHLPLKMSKPPQVSHPIPVNIWSK